ncbi:hypothetical protein K523DRAFT_420538 [Schizophyllum commune Tattone D]|nr:hypothetical protein K523DRAFT_420538 [Schizophyllum commune Tattone D]
MNMSEDPDRRAGRRSERTQREERTDPAQKSKKRSTSEAPGHSSRLTPPATSGEPVHKSRRHHSTVRPACRQDETTTRAEQSTPSQTEHVRQLEGRVAAAEQTLLESRRRASERERGLRQQGDKLKHDLSLARHENDEYALRLADLQGKLDATEKERDELRRQCRRHVGIPEEELEVARRFLEASDHLSEADVQGQVERLNEEIALLATSIAEDAPDERTGSEASQIDPRTAKFVRQLLGEQIILALGRSHANADDRTTYRQIAMQICLSQFSAHLINSWYGDVQETSAYWDAVYDQVRHVEEHAVASQWRVITRRSMRAAQRCKPRTEDGLTTFLLDLLSAAQAIAQYGSRSEHHIAEAFSQAFKERVAFLIKLGIELNESVGYGVSRHDLVVFGFEHGSAFDESLMSDYWGRPESRRNGRRRGEQEQDLVAGNCALGLKRRSAIDRGPTDGSGAADGGLVLLRAGVVLCSTLRS